MEFGFKKTLGEKADVFIVPSAEGGMFLIDGYSGHTEAGNLIQFAGIPTEIASKVESGDKGALELLVKQDSDDPSVFYVQNIERGESVYNPALTTGHRGGRRGFLNPKIIEVVPFRPLASFQIDSLDRR